MMMMIEDDDDDWRWFEVVRDDDDDDDRCLGSSSFLKNRFGIGYHLTVVKGDTCDVAAIEGGVRRFVSTAKVHIYIRSIYIKCLYRL